MDKKYLTRKEVVALLGIHLNTLQNWEKKNVLVPKRLGRRIFYLESDIDAAFNSHSRQ